MKKKKIGIVGYPVGDGFGIGSSYLQFFSTFGDVEIIGHTETEIREDLDLLVIPGGPDVDTARYLYDEYPLNLNVGKPCIFRERFDRVLLSKYIKNNTPIFGICRGHQSIAVHFGAQLNQHMWHETNGSNRSELVHGITINPNKELGIERIKYQDVNSIHHQTIMDDTLPEFADVLARYDTRGKAKSNYTEIEAVSYLRKYPIITVQYHPEEIYDDLGIMCVEYLLNL